MKTKVPVNAPSELQEYSKRLQDELDNEFQKRTPDLNPRNNLLLRSPDGSIWAVAVDDTGTIAATKVYG